MRYGRLDHVADCDKAKLSAEEIRQVYADIFEGLQEDLQDGARPESQDDAQ